MITIGQQRLAPVRRRIPGTKKFERVKDSAGGTMSKVRLDEVWRQTRGELGPTYGRDKRRRLVIGLVAPDLLVFYPKGTRQRITVEIKRVYYEALYHLAVSRQLERARARKIRLRELRAKRRLESMERRLRKKAST